MIVRERDNIINQILIELKNKEEFIDSEIKKEIIMNNYKNIETWIELFQLNNNLNYITRLLINLRELKNNDIIEIWDDFLTGHCHEFAIALNLLFGYKIGIIHGKSKGIFGEELEYLFHAFAIDEKNQSFDVQGKYDYEMAVNMYKNQKNPKTGNVADEVHMTFFDSHEEFKREFNKVEYNNDYINKAIKKICASPLNYFSIKHIESSMELPRLSVNKNYSPEGEYYFHFKNETRIFQNYSIKIKKNYNNLGIWKISSVSSSYNGFFVKLGLGSYDFDLISTHYKISWIINENLTDEESKINIINYFKELNVLDIENYI